MGHWMRPIRTCDWTPKKRRKRTKEERGWKNRWKNNRSNVKRIVWRIKVRWWRDLVIPAGRKHSLPYFSWSHPQKRFFFCFLFRVPSDPVNHIHPPASDKSAEIPTKWWVIDRSNKLAESDGCSVGVECPFFLVQIWQASKSPAFIPSTPFN